jgi:2,4-dienoyl-CoA reductase-like NADH-dependent reductase (Old Yellow Enzyme family)
VLFGPHETNLGRGRALSERHVAYYARRAAGGCGVVVTETASVHGSDWPYERAPLAADCGPGWADVVAACRPHGALVLASLGHTGAQGSSGHAQTALWAPSAVPDVVTREVPVAMEQPEIDALVAGFAAGARIAVGAGADGVEVDAGARSLLRQFASGLTTTRTDGYGADRLRLLREVLVAVRAELGPGRALALRLSCDEEAPWAGITPDLAVGHVRELAPLVDLLVVVRGGGLTPSAYRPDGHTAPGSTPTSPAPCGRPPAGRRSCSRARSWTSPPRSGRWPTGSPTPWR